MQRTLDCRFIETDRSKNFEENVAGSIEPLLRHSTNLFDGIFAFARLFVLKDYVQLIQSVTDLIGKLPVFFLSKLLPYLNK